MAKQHKTGLANLLVPLVKIRSFRTWHWDTLTIANANDALKCVKYKIKTVVLYLKPWCYLRRGQGPFSCQSKLGPLPMRMTVPECLLEQLLHHPLMPKARQIQEPAGWPMSKLCWSSLLTRGQCEWLQDAAEHQPLPCAHYWLNRDMFREGAFHGSCY